MAGLPIRLKVPGKDEVFFTEVSTTSFRFHGFLYVEDEGLRLEWQGFAKVEEVGITGVTEREVPLPAEEVTVPYGELRSVRLGGMGPWSFVELVEGRLGALKVIPSADNGRVRCWVKMGDRAMARALVADVAAVVG